MNYFNCAILLKKNTPYRSYKIYKAVYNKDMKAYAKKIYGSNYQDALDNAYRHILENYDSEKGELSHYTIAIIHNINFNATKKEVSIQDVTSLAMDNKAFKDNNGDPLDELLSKQGEYADKSVENCVQYLLKYYITDFKFFKSNKSSDRVNDYGDLYDKFSVKTILSAVKVISEKYDSDIEELYNLKKQLRFKSYTRDRYMESFDNAVEYMCEFNGIVIYKKHTPKGNKVVYEIDIEEVLKRFKKVFYNGMLNRKIGNVDCFISLSGKLFINEAELNECIENELIGSILSRVQQMGVMRYESGKSILLTSSAPMTRTSIVLLILDTAFQIDMLMRVSKSVK